MTFVFLPDTCASANENVARCAEEALAKGPMANTVRGDEYEAFLTAAYGNGRTARTIATSCAVFAGACCILAGAQAKRGIPKARAITTWLGVKGFLEDDPDTEAVEGSWIPLAELDAPMRGDVFYICSTAGKMGDYTWTRWEAAANGHVGILLEDGFLTRTAEGGGSPGGTGCRMSATQKDIRSMGRTLRGVWRPNLMQGRDVHDTQPDGFMELHAGMPKNPRVEQLQTWLMKLGATLKSGADGRFGTKETEPAVRWFQITRHIPETGIVDRRTWDTLKAEAER